MARHRFTFDIAFRHVVDVEVEEGTPRSRSRVAATSYLANQVALMDWEDVLCHAQEVLPLEGVEAAEEPTADEASAYPPQAVIVPVEPPVVGAGYAFHPDDPAGRHEASIHLHGHEGHASQRLH